MSKDEIVNVGTIGHVDHGRSTISQKITKIAIDEGFSVCPTGHEPWYIRLRESGGINPVLKPVPGEDWKGKGKQKKRFVK